MKELLQLVMGVIVLTLMVAIAGCPKPPPNPGYPDADAAADARRCHAAPAICLYCARMRQIGCDEGKPSPNGASCETVTTNVQAVPYAAMDLVCRTRAGDCKTANACR